MTSVIAFASARFWVLVNTPSTSLMFTKGMRKSPLGATLDWRGKRRTPSIDIDNKFAVGLSVFDQLMGVCSGLKGECSRIKAR
ncbi:hypothetical protein CN128_31000 [Sinorhizobium meliloti]|nr:hypothetical protein CDO24_32905 [Sinorhizobium meliloti]PTD30280.1 hypothetical protein C5N13_03665 [Sinorhizobium meliloti]RVH57910.1 hypothetical protein CN198_32935 [Sinorhizobium meliloti]RVI25647.1 hypothetical protein CN202_21425 [Sinorhizobium meliloti]RVK61091.1 hypothetical protein CN159_32685 [Sinorhizobium meliloti]